MVENLPKKWEIIITDHAIERYKSRYCSPLSKQPTDKEVVEILTRRARLGFPRLNILTHRTVRWILTPPEHRTPEMANHVQKAYLHHSWKGHIVVGDMTLAYVQEGYNKMIITTILWPTLTPLDDISEEATVQC